MPKSPQPQHDNIVRRRLRLFSRSRPSKSYQPARRAPELEPSTRAIHNSNRELRACHRAVQRERLGYAATAINDLVQSNANNDEPFQTVHIIHTVDDKQLLRVAARASVSPRGKIALAVAASTSSILPAATASGSRSFNKRHLARRRHAVIQVL